MSFKIISIHFPFLVFPLPFVTGSPSFPVNASSYAAAAAAVAAAAAAAAAAHQQGQDVPNQFSYPTSSLSSPHSCGSDTFGRSAHITNEGRKSQLNETLTGLNTDDPVLRCANPLTNRVRFHIFMSSYCFFCVSIIL